MTDQPRFADRSFSHGLLFADELVPRIAADEKLTTIRPVAPSTARLTATARHLLDGALSSMTPGDFWRRCKPGTSSAGVLDLPFDEIAFSRVQAGDTIWVREAWRPYALQARTGDPFGVRFEVLKGQRPARGAPVGITYRVNLERRLLLQEVYFGREPFGGGDSYADMLCIDDGVALAGWAWPKAASSANAKAWCSSLIMPELAARLRRTVAEVRVVRLLDVDEDAARLDGFEDRASFQTLWNAAYQGKNLGTDANPWVWIYRWEPSAVPARGGADG